MNYLAAAMLNLSFTLAWCGIALVLSASYGIKFWDRGLLIMGPILWVTIMNTTMYLISTK